MSIALNLELYGDDWTWKERERNGNTGSLKTHSTDSLMGKECPSSAMSYIHTLSVFEVPYIIG